MNNLVSERLRFIGRRDVIEILDLACSGDRSPIIYLEGIAGIGKTAVLDEAASLARKHGAFCPAVIDFYDTRVHSHQGLEATIADSLDPDRKAFTGYWEQRQKDRQADLWDLFRVGYVAAVDSARVVLRFDTAERLEYERESEEVLRDCEVRELDAPSWEWLLRRIGFLPNTVVLIAARPTPSGLLRKRLVETYQDRALLLKIDGFTLSETKTYFRAIDFGRQVVKEAPDMIEKIGLLSDGRPILIALALDWLQRGMWDPRLYPADVKELRQLKAQAEREEAAAARGEIWRRWRGVQKRFEIALVDRIRDLVSPLDVAVRYVALCRKGCNIELLQRLMRAGGHEFSEKETQRLVEQLRNLSFVKPPRPGSRDLFFLHDEMYDLVESYVWLVDWPDYREQARLDRTIVDWYTEQVEAYRERIRQAQGWQARGQLRREQQLLMAERLYYQFDEDPRLGYREYSHLDEEAIAQRELEWDTWLRNEAVWFTTYRAWRHGDQSRQASGYPLSDPATLQNGQVVRSPAVDYDCRRRWVSRHIAHNRMLEAIKITKKLLARPQLREEPELYRGSVQIALATAQAYLAGEHIEAAVENFDAGIQALLSVPIEHREPWLHPFLLGNAYLYKGLAVRGTLSLDEAALANSRAIRYFRKIDYRPGLAEATNNLAYVLTRQGRLDPALNACNKGLRTRQELGDEYGIGLSLNTKGIIHERLGNPVTAIQNSEQALALFREIGNVRGIMMAHINLGRAYRRMARSIEWEQKNVDFEKGRYYLEEAIRAQNPDSDKFYQVEALDELGCLYRDWAATLHEKGEQNDQIAAFLDVAEETLQNAAKLTSGQGDKGMPRVVQYVDLLEDLAHVHYWRERLATPCNEGNPLIVMEDVLDRAEAFARECLEGQGEIKLVLAKVFFQKARLARLKRQDVAEVASYYGLAAGYAESHSWDAPEARKTVADACDWLDELDDEEAKQAIRAAYDALARAGLHSRRLYDSIENVVKPLLGIDWQANEQEASDG